MRKQRNRAPGFPSSPGAKRSDASVLCPPVREILAGSYNPLSFPSTILRYK
ncbi:MAG: hypothetical protein LBD06_02210 [Candidatus Accumulibacter sp.]|nr:hypothetical protein [Accumulibacter sp.]